jgi:tRNA-splicing ligase RtcB
MNLALDFAAENRQRMMQECISVVLNMVKKYDGFSGIELGEQVNIHHNYAAMENHYGQNVMVHRKGATKATEKTTGLIPGSMGTASYVVQGLGNPESFMSCSHGAGRRMGRKEAIRTLDLEGEKKKMEGIVHGLTNKDKLDEAPGAYKDIEVVMNNQKDLVRIIKTLYPIASIKG